MRILISYFNSPFPERYKLVGGFYANVKKSDLCSLLLELKTAGFNTVLYFKSMDDLKYMKDRKVSDIIRDYLE